MPCGRRPDDFKARDRYLRKAENLTFDSIIGKVMLIGITVMTGDKLVEQKQYHGTIVYACEGDRISIRQDDGSIYSVPPDLSNMLAAEPGEYRERSTGATVVDPDYIASWTVERRKETPDS